MYATVKAQLHLGLDDGGCGLAGDDGRLDRDAGARMADGLAFDDLPGNLRRANGQDREERSRCLRWGAARPPPNCESVAAEFRDFFR